MVFPSERSCCNRHISHGHVTPHNLIELLLQAIKATSIALGIKIDAKPSKIVAGIEPEKTNLWLQAMAKCITKKISTVVAVAQVRCMGDTRTGLALLSLVLLYSVCIHCGIF